MPIITTKCYEVEYNDNIEIKNKVFDKLIEFYTKHQAFCGESICQNDDPQLDAPDLLSDIADNIITFKYLEEK